MVIALDGAIDASEKSQMHIDVGTAAAPAAEAPVSCRSPKRPHECSVYSKWKSPRRAPQSEHDGAPDQSTPATAAAHSARSVSISFPTREMAARCTRSCVIPTRFSSIAEYIQCMNAAVFEETQLRVNEFAQQFYKAMDKCQSAPLQAGDGRSGRGHGGNRTSHSDIIAGLKRHGMHAFEGSIQHGSRGRHGQGRGDAQGCGDRTFLTICGNDLPSSCFSTNDIWIISRDATFPSNRTFFCRSMWHGPSRDSGKLEVEPFGRSLQNTLKFGVEEHVYALKGPDMQTEYTIINYLGGIASGTTSAPVLSHICGLEKGGSGQLNAGGGQRAARESDTAHYSDDAAAMSILDHTGTVIALNSSQKKVIHKVSTWFGGGNSIEDVDTPICLVRGPFGTGKSHMLAALVIKLIRDGASAGLAPRILITGHTNNAVDRVLCALIKMGFRDFARTGSLRSIEKSVLPYSVHVSAGGGGTKRDDTLSELRQMLSRETSVKGREIIEGEIDNLRDGRLQERMARLKTVKVVGTTCCSSLNDALKGQSFDLCLLDEASQIIEPLVSDGVASSNF